MPAEEALTIFRSTTRIALCVLALALVATACADDDVAQSEGTASGTSGDGFAVSEDCFSDPELQAINAEAARAADISGTELTLVAYDSFVVSDGIFEQFEEATGATVNVLATADTGTMVSQAVLTVGDPVADVMWGIDNTFMCRALEAEVFTPYTAVELDRVDTAAQSFDGITSLGSVTALDSGYITVGSQAVIDATGDWVTLWTSPDGVTWDRV